MITFSYIKCGEQIGRIQMKKNDQPWRKDENFIKLCDIVASNKLICLTGSGISKNLLLKDGKSAPDWKDLLLEINDRINSGPRNLEKNQEQDLKKLLSRKPSGEQLIEAASMLYNIDKDVFDKSLRESVDLKVGQTSDVHRKLLDLKPRGILTYNYDVAHENALNERGAKNWSTILPADGEKIVDLIKNDLDKNFLFKMHGSVDPDTPMILTRDSYRDLFIKNPQYRAFMQHVFTNFQLLIVGFGLSDPDFDLLLQNVFSVFGSPVQEHIVIRHKKDRTPKDTLYRLRYGISFIYVNEYGQIADIIDDCTKYPGNTLNEILKKCIHPDKAQREEAHRMVRNLSEVGKKCLANILEAYITENIGKEGQKYYGLNTKTSEYVYTYGVIASSTKNKEYKDFLIHNVVEKSIYSEPVAHALYNLRDAVDESDMETAKKWTEIFSDDKKRRFKHDPHNKDPYNRVLKYAEAIYYYLCAKYL